jgi:hypothetical protein
MRGICGLMPEAYILRGRITTLTQLVQVTHRLWEGINFWDTVQLRTIYICPGR